MIKRLLFSEPTLVATFVKALLVVGVAWGMPLTGDQTLALVGLVVPSLALLGAVNRAVVTPVKKVTGGKQ